MDKQPFGLQMVVCLTVCRIGHRPTGSETLRYVEPFFKVKQAMDTRIDTYHPPKHICTCFRSIGALQGRQWKLHRAAIGRSYGAVTVYEKAESEDRADDKSVESEDGSAESEDRATKEG
jgi:hypothetical protein